MIPQLVLTTTGRKSRAKREVQLAYVDNGGVVHLIASNFGGKNHPGVSYNLGANPEATVQLGSDTFDLSATQLSDEAKEGVWQYVVAAIPNYDVYKTRADRNIKVYRLDKQ